MLNATVSKALAAKKYVLSKADYRQASDVTAQNVYRHNDGSYYTITTFIATGTVKSWFYRGLGGDAKSDKFYNDCAAVNGRDLVKHLNANKKTKPKTRHTRRTSEQVRRDSFVMYD